MVGGGWRGDHAILTGDVAHRLLNYLVMGEPVVVTATRMDDVVDRTRKAVVAMNFRTDGYWALTTVPQSGGQIRAYGV